MRLSRFLCALCVGLTLETFPLMGLAGHGSWTDHYQDAAGIMCCTAGRDCQQVAGRLLGRQGERVLVEVQGIALWFPERSVHPSEDGAFWVCLKGSAWEERGPLRADQIRCVFLATGG